MNNRRMKTVCCLAAAVMAIAGAGALPAGTFTGLDVSASAADIVESGKCGEYCNYTLDSDGTLTISGSGKMYDYRTISSNKNCTQDSAPWSGRGESIKKVMIKTGVTYVGNSAFERLPELERVLIPEGVTGIGVTAFKDSPKLKVITIPDSITEFGGSAFVGTQWLKTRQAEDPLVVLKNILIDGTTASSKVVIPDGVTSIGKSAFRNNKAITDVEIPVSVKRIESQAFEGCEALKKLTVHRKMEFMGYNCFGLYQEDGQEKHYSDAVIYCYSQSKAYYYARGFNVKYVLLDLNGDKVLPGDVNNNRAINSADLALMQQKLAGWDVKDFNEAAADVNNDGVFNSEDIAHFQKYLAGWNLLLGV